MISAGVEAGKNTRGVTWTRTWQNGPVSLIPGAEPDPEAGNISVPAAFNKKSKPG